MLGSEFQEMLRCIRCGACMNHCPVYGAVGGHAYGWVYPGPMGSVLTPAIIGIEEAAPLPNASTLCGRCEAVCPMKIPLPRMLRDWREREAEGKHSPAAQRWGLGVHAWLASHPGAYRLATRLAALGLRVLGGRKGRVSALPGAAGWTQSRDMAVPPRGGTFMDQIRKQRRSGS